MTSPVRNETSASGSGVAGSNQPVARFGRDSERRNAPPPSGRRASPSPSSPLSTQERHWGACTAHTEISFLLLLFGHINTSNVHVIFFVRRQAMRVRLPPPAPSDATGVRGPDRTSFINAAAVRSSTGFCSFSPAPVGIQAGQAISPSGRRGLGNPPPNPLGG